jgi:hypothetical protein
MTSSEKEVSALRDRLAFIKPVEQQTQGNESFAKKSHQELVEKYAEIKGGIPINFEDSAQKYMNKLSPLIEHDEIHHTHSPNNDDVLMRESSREVRSFKNNIHARKIK